MKTIPYFLLPLCLGLLIRCQETDDDLGPTLPSTGCDGDLTGTDCQQFFVAEGEILSYPTGTHIKASEGIEINGDIVIDPAAGGDFTLTATSGDIVIAGKILVKDTTDDNSSGGRYKNGKSTSRLKNGKAADGFTLTLDARGTNGIIILKKGATLFSGRGQYAPDETLTSLSGYYEGAGGGNGGLIMLNAPNGKVKLPDVGSGVTEFQNEVIVLGKGGNGANIELAENLETGNLDVVEVRGGLGGNAGQLIIDAQEIEGIPALEAMETHPDFIYGGKGGIGGYVKWRLTQSERKYSFQEIIFHGGDGGDGATVGGDGGFAYFLPPYNPISEVGDPVAHVFCYGGDGGHVFASPLPLKEGKGGNGGEYVANGVVGWHGGEDKNGNLIRDGANGGNALGQGGNGGDILAGVSAYQATGGSGGNSEVARYFLPNLIGAADQDFLSGAYGVKGGNGGDGYNDCSGCRGGDGGDIGTATALGGKGGDVLGTVIQSSGGRGGDNWAVLKGNPGIGGDGNPPGAGGTSPAGIVLTAYPGEGGNGTTEGRPGETLLLDPEIGVQGIDGNACGEEAECEEDDMNPPTDGESCREEGAGFVYKSTETTTNANSMSETIINIAGTYVEGGCGASLCFMCDRTRTQTITYTDGREPRIYTTSGTGLCSTMISPFCTQDGQLFYPAGNSSVSYSYNDTQVTVTFTGCYADEQAPHTCCQGEDGRYYFWGGETCPE